MKNIVAIDPGIGGGIAWVDSEGQVRCQAMPQTEGDIIALMVDIAMSCREAFIEDVGKGIIPGRSAAMIVLNVNAAVIRTALACLGVRVIMVRPQEWQKTFSLGTRKVCATDSIWKGKLKSEAQRRFPELTITNATADALLIFEYGQNL